MEARHLIFPLLSACCVALNACVLVVLFRTKNLRRIRFNCLVLYLSISDTLTGVLALISAVTYALIDRNNEEAHYICTFFGSLLGATVIFSMYQVLLICLERLQATYRIPSAHLRRMVSDKSVAIGFVVIHCYAMASWAYEIQMYNRNCVLLPTIAHLIMLDCPVILLTVITGLFCLIIMLRISKQYKSVQSQSESNPQFPGNKRMDRMKRNIITLGIIVFISSVIVMPRPIASIVFLISDNNDVNSNVLTIVTSLMILNPIIDPIIYVLRIKAFREHIKCCRVSRRLHINSVRSGSRKSMGIQEQAGNRIVYVTRTFIL